MATVQGQGGIHGIFSAFTQATTGRTAAQAERNKAREMSVCRKVVYEDTLVVGMSRQNGAIWWIGVGMTITMNLYSNSPQCFLHFHSRKQGSTKPYTSWGAAMLCFNLTVLWYSHNPVSGESTWSSPAPVPGSAPPSLHPAVQTSHCCYTQEYSMNKLKYSSVFPCGIEVSDFEKWLRTSLQHWWAYAPS